MANWFWKDHPLSLRVVVIVISALFLLLAVGQLHAWLMSSRSFVRLLLAFLFAASGYGILRMAMWARWVAVTLLWLCAILFIVGIFNPYTASDWMIAGKSPSIATLLAFVIPAEVVIFLLLHVLGRYKGRFV